MTFSQDMADTWVRGLHTYCRLWWTYRRAAPGDRQLLAEDAGQLSGALLDLAAETEAALTRERHPLYSTESVFAHPAATVLYRAAAGCAQLRDRADSRSCAPPSVFRKAFDDPDLDLVWELIDDPVIEQQLVELAEMIRR